MMRACNVWICVAFCTLLRQSNADKIGTKVKDERRELFRFRGSVGCSGLRNRLTKKITSVLEDHPNLGFTTDLIKEVGLWGVLDESAVYTLFVPKDRAFDLEKDLVVRIHQPQYFLHAKSLVQQHIVQSQICSSSFANGDEFEALNGDGFIYIVNPDGGYLYTPPPEASRVDTTEQIPVGDVDIQALNGVIHTVDRFILPQWVFLELFDLLAADEFSTMKELASRAGIEDTFRYLPKARTVFAPTNKAFQNVKSSHRDCLYGDQGITVSVLFSHVVDGIINAETVQSKEFATLEEGVTVSVVSDGSSMTVNGVAVFDSDNLAYNGILHGIDTVLLPDSFGCQFDEQSANEAEGGTILGRLKEEGLTTIATLIEKAGLSDFFTDPNADITIFAPVEAAFEGLTPHTLFCLTTSDEALKSLLQYHTLDTIYYAVDLTTAKLFPTTDARRPLLINGLTSNDGLTQVNDAGILEGDVVASNGVIHKISRVIHAVGAECM
mmetsp:Transcript_13480/g.25848  ORF Transcript_13480/g.25848 Transcript_13480/m.25848 type:complete len:495 (-) Transcript_13480:58-1542(-)